jgi:DNA (cytosine-5)-methyltransferase 1
MKVVSLFSGAGGLDLGFIQAGHEVIWANDLSKMLSRLIF